MIRTFYILILCILTFSIISGQAVKIDDRLHFRYLTIEDDLTNNKVNVISQDNNGFIWIGTDEGLNRYDGYKLTAVRNPSLDTANSISDQISELHCDSKGKLWIGYNDRLEVLNMETNEFTNITYNGIAIENIQDIIQDENNNVWIGSAQGLYYYNLDSQELHFYNDENPNFSLIDIFSIIIDHKGNIWVGTHDFGAHIIPANSNQVHHIKITRAFRVESLFEDDNNNVWIGTLNNGLFKYTLQDSSFKELIINPNDPYTLRIRSIGQDLNGVLYFGTRGGLYRKDLYSDDFILLARADLEISKLLYSSIFSILIDRYNMIWVGTYTGGGNYADLGQKKFFNIPCDHNNLHEGLNSEIVYAIEEDEKGNFYFGTANGGINYYNNTTGEFSYYVQRRESDGAGNTVYWITRESPQKYWFGMYMGGIGILNPESKKVYYSDPERNGCHQLDGISVYDYTNDSRGNIWLSTEKGLMLKNEDGCFYSISEDIGVLPDDKVLVTFEDHKRNLWVGTEKYGLFLHKGNEFKPFRPDIIKGTIQIIFEDSKNNLWVGGSKSGLTCIGKDTIVKYTIADGLSSNSICSILEDDERNLWVSTHLGLLKFENAVDEPFQKTPSIRIYNESDGLSSKQFSSYAAKKASDGRLYFGSIKGVTYFKPSEIENNTIPPNVVLTKLLITNEEIIANKEFRGRILLNKNIAYTDKVGIDQRDKIFTIEFAGIHYADPEKNIYRYMLENFDEDWNYTSSDRRFATYTNLNGQLQVYCTGIK